MPDQNMPNQASNKDKAEGDRWRSDSNTVERRDEQAGGIPTRPIEEEREKQEALPSRGQSRRDNDE